MVVKNVLITLVSLGIFWSAFNPVPCYSEEARPLVIDHDAGIDDFISCTLQLLHSAERVKAITIVPADSFASPAAWVMKQLIHFLLPVDPQIPLGISAHEGVNPFPTEWRNDSWSLSRLPLWGCTCPADVSCDGLSTSLEVLAKVLGETKIPVDILETGPCTNIAELLVKYPELKNKIHRVHMMGGALYAKGNVEVVGRDGSAEWNIYNNPQALWQILESGVPLTLVGLDATQYTPIRREFMDKIQHQLDVKACKFVNESLKVIQPLIDSGQYMFWDTLTSVSLIELAVLKTKRVKINVVLDGPSMGRSFEDAAQGWDAEVAVWADRELFEKTVLSILLQQGIT
jgi:purine nucleosidase